MLSVIKNIFRGNTKIDLREKYSLEAMQDFVEENINTIIKSSIDDLGKSPEEIANAKKRKDLFKKQLNNCGLGDISSKQFIKSWITDLVTQKYGVNEDNIDYIINFDFPGVYDKFCIMLNRYKKKYKYDALKNFIWNNNLDLFKKIDDEKMYGITEDDIKHIYENESYGAIRQLSFQEKLEIVVQRIYEASHGLSVIDEIRDMNCDGISIGVSGIPIDFVTKINDMNAKNNTSVKYPLSYESVWLYFEGKEIYLKFMSFGSQRELERVCRKLYKFNNQRQFTKSDGFIFNNMADFSRIAVFRPPYSEGWAAFIRKFDIDGDLELIEGQNAHIVRELIDFIVKAKENLCLSGQQGAGKTTMLVGVVKRMYGNLTLRIWESYFETFLRFKKYNRNIVTLRETDELDGERALDSIKKTNGNITIISEAAEDKIKNYVIKSALAASECVLWTDHSETADDLVQTHRNACLNVGSFRDEDKAEEEVLSILKWNVHLKKDNEGHRYIERITEFIRLDQRSYNQQTDTESFYENTRKFFEKKTNAKKYKAVNIIEYNIENKKYVVKNEISELRKKDIYNKLMEEDKERFLKFLNEVKEVI